MQLLHHKNFTRAAYLPADNIELFGQGVCGVWGSALQSAACWPTGKITSDPHVAQGSVLVAGFRRARRLGHHGPYLPTALEDLLLDLNAFGAFGLRDLNQILHVLIGAVAKAERPCVAWRKKLNFQLPSVPARLRLIVVRVNHRCSLEQEVSWRSSLLLCRRYLSASGFACFVCEVLVVVHVEVKELRTANFDDAICQ